jgi:hypothetical protein
MPLALASCGALYLEQFFLNILVLIVLTIQSFETCLGLPPDATCLPLRPCTSFGRRKFRDFLFINTKKQQKILFAKKLKPKKNGDYSLYIK